MNLCKGICNTCEIEKILDELEIWESKNLLVYECIDRKMCNRNKFENQIKNTINITNNYKEISFKKIFGFSFNELEEISTRLRDLSVHYIDKQKKNVYSWHLVKKIWYQPDEKNLINILNKLDY